LTSHLLTFDVHCHEFNETRELVLVSDPSDKHLEYVKNEWTPILEAFKDRAFLAYRALPPQDQSQSSFQDKLGLFGAPDAHWDWTYKRNNMSGLSHRMYAVLDGESVEALMRVDLSKQSRLDKTPLTPIVYVDYLAIAPWNRRPIQQPPRFNGLGTVLLGTAVSLSNNEGMDGRCGLHSLIQAEGFYKGAGMTDLGADPAADGLKYFEFSPQAAELFLKE